MKVIYVDIDETICKRETSRDFGVVHDYSKAQPIQENWEELTRQQLDSWGAKYHELKVDKPFYDLFIEDKALRIEEL